MASQSSTEQPQYDSSIEEFDDVDQAEWLDDMGISSDNLDELALAVGGLEDVSDNGELDEEHPRMHIAQARKQTQPDVMSARARRQNLESQPGHYSYKWNPTGKDFETTSAEYNEALESSKWNLVRRVLSDEINAAGLNIDDDTQPSSKSLQQEAYRMALSIDDRVLKSCIDGNLPELATNDREFRDYLDALLERANNESQPMIYQQAQVDKNGLPPTLQDMQEMLDVFKTYCFEDQPSREQEALINAIDCWKAPNVELSDTQNGKRKYLTSKEKLRAVDGGVQFAQDRLDRARKYHAHSRKVLIKQKHKAGIDWASKRMIKA
ncbi:hypothetical protein AC578_595 [Pseudocercospora eumusae]|uniref:Uncharacterized protein n=1 Tax=Pseudocercospora eumusae TaxID=321146 RepID=A0A139HFG4_9PEZI|nr:hypothetical protein AC578_595 [Pseudocercospora eumusae]